jgi:hypothetical protein
MEARQDEAPTIAIRGRVELKLAVAKNNEVKPAYNHPMSHVTT